MEHYILKGKEIVKCPMMEWAKWLENDNNRIIKQDRIDGIFISTIFLGIDHGHLGGQPVLFETMIKDKKRNQEFERYCTYDEALKGHEEKIQKLNTIK